MCSNIKQQRPQMATVFFLPPPEPHHREATSSTMTLMASTTPQRPIHPSPIEVYTSVHRFHTSPVSPRQCFSMCLTHPSLINTHHLSPPLPPAHDPCRHCHTRSPACPHMWEAIPVVCLCAPTSSATPPQVCSSTCHAHHLTK